MKKILIYISVLVVILVLAAYFYFKDKDPVVELNPITVSKVEKDFSWASNNTEGGDDPTTTSFKIGKNSTLDISFYTPPGTCMNLGSTCDGTIFTLTTEGVQKEILRLEYDRGGGNYSRTLHVINKEKNIQQAQQSYVDTKGNLYIMFSGNRVNKSDLQILVFNSSGFIGAINGDNFPPPYFSSDITMYSDSSGTYIITNRNSTFYNNNEPIDVPEEVYKVNL